MKKYKHIKNPEQLKGKLTAVMKEVYESENPHAITEYRRFFKENVGIFSRSFISAYIIKKFLDVNDAKSSITSSKKRPYQEFDTQNREPNSMPSPPGSQKNGANDTRYKKIIIKNINRENTTEKEFMSFITSFKDVTENNVVELKVGEQNVVLQVTQPAFKLLLHNFRITKFKGVKLYISTPNGQRR